VHRSTPAAADTARRIQLFVPPRNPKTVPPVELEGQTHRVHKEANYLAHVVRREGRPRSPPCRAPDDKSEAKASATVVARRGTLFILYYSVLFCLRGWTQSEYTRQLFTPDPCAMAAI
jgi:hypothetical protein